MNRKNRSKRSDGDARLVGALPNPGHTAMQLESDRLGLLGDTQVTFSLMLPSLMESPGSYREWEPAAVNGGIRIHL